MKKLKKDSFKKVELKPCEVLIQFKVPRDKVEHIRSAANELRKLGISFDTGGGPVADPNKSGTMSDLVTYDWEFDWSLKGPVQVLFRRFKEKE